VSDDIIWNSSDPCHLNVAKKSLALTHDSDECASSPVQNNTADRSFRAIDALHAHSKSLSGERRRTVLLCRQRIVAKEGLAQNAFTYYYAHRRLSKAQMEKVDADVMQNRCVIIKNRYSVNRYWHWDKHQDTSSIWDWFNASGRTTDHGSEKTILEKK
jgi:hypothetical protein